MRISLEHLRKEFLALGVLPSMVDLTITAANVEKGEGAVTEDGTAAEAITAGQAVFLNTSDKYELADAEVAAEDVVRGIALHASELDQPLRIQRSGKMDLGATLTIGKIYVLSGTAGGIAPVDDLASSDYVTLIGIATAADSLTLFILATEVQVP